jgi:hypothetical protein
MRNETMNTKNTYRTDCMRRVKGEDGKLSVKRWVEDRAVSATLTTHEGGVFYKGARIA